MSIKKGGEMNQKTKKENVYYFEVEEVQIAPNRLYPLQFAKEVWGVSLPLLYRAARKGLFKSVRLGRKWMVPGKEILRVLEEGWRK